MADSILVSDTSDGLCTITLNRPEKKNALSIALRDELTDALGRLESDPDAKVVAITGTGDFFSAGFDLNEFQQAAADPAFDKKLWTSSDRYHRACLTFPLPLIAALNGPAIAGGFDLGVMCDIRIATPETYFSHPEIAFGAVMYSPLQELVGGAVARELCLTGRRVDAEEALRLHLVSSVVPKSELIAEVQKFADWIKQASRENLMATKAKIVKRAAIDTTSTLAL